MLTSSVNTKSTFPFTPGSLTNCVCWLDAADTSSYTPTSITTWRNKVVYGSSPANASYTNNGSVNSSVQVNNLKVLTVTSVNSEFPLQFRLPTIPYTQTTRTIFYLINNYPPSSELRYQGYTDTFSDSTTFILYNDDTSLFKFGDIYGNLMSAAVVFNTTSILCITTNVGFFVDGTYISSSSSPGPITLGIGSSSNQTIGMKRTSGSQAGESLNIGDFLIFDGALTDIERQQVEGYLANKWGIASQLPTTHPYYSSTSAILYRPVNRAFQPVDIAGCGLWLDGADKSTMTITSGNVTQWNDKSGNGYNATVAPGRTAGTYSDANNCVNFPVASTGYVTSFPANPTQETMFVVATNSSPSVNNNTIIGGQYGARSLGFGYSGSLYPSSSSACAYLNNEVRWLATTPTGTYTAGTTAIVTGYVLSSSTTAISFNGGIFYTDSTSGGFLSGTTTYLGVDTGTPDYYFVGLAKEIIFYNSVLTPAQTQLVQQYLAQKWNISSSMPTGHPGKFLRAFSTGFTPKALGTLNLWLDASDSSTITLSSGSLTAWADKSGTGYTASRYTGDGGTLTTSTTAGRTSVYTSSPRMIIPSFVWNNAFTQFIVARASNNSITIGLSDVEFGANYLNQYNWIYTLNGPLVLLNKTLNIVDSSWPDPVPVANTWVILCIGFNLGPPLTHYTLNGTSRLSSAGSSVSAGSNTGYFTINGLSYLSDGEKYIGEILHYNRSITVNERQQIEGYLAWKWGIQSSLPSTHPYIKSSP